MVSDRVGWGWTLKAMSSGSAPISMPSTVSEMSSPACGPTMPAPTRRRVSPSKMSFVRPSSRPLPIARPLAAHGKVAFSIARPAAFASVSVTPTHAISGSVYATEGMDRRFERRLAAGRDLGRDLPLVGRPVGEEGRPGDVPDREDVRHVRALALVDGG